MVARKDNEGVPKSLFKRKRGLSKFYANKAQSFSSLDHALSTCMGHSALALEKPQRRSFDASPKSDVDVEVLSPVTFHCTVYLCAGMLIYSMTPRVAACDHQTPTKARFLQVTSRALNRLHEFESQNGSLQRDGSMTAALCTVLELSTLSNCDSDNTTVSIDSDMQTTTRPKSPVESPRPDQSVRDTTSCPLPRSASDQSMEIMASRRLPSMELPSDKATS